MQSLAYETVRLEVEDGVATLTLARPEKMNSLSVVSMRELRDVMKSLPLRGDVRALLLTGEGRSFCTGVDLTAAKPGVDPNDRDEMLRDYHLPFFQSLRECPIPTVAAVNGAAIGAGLSLALHCDIVIAGRSAYFTAGFVNIALAPDTGASWVLTQALGEARARGMLLLGERLGAEQAADWGLIWKTVDDDALMNDARAIATRFSRGPSLAYKEIKRVMRKVNSNSWRDHVLAEAEAQTVVRVSHDAQEARTAYREKRPPIFNGT